jgi:hypothetical protein
MGQAQAAETRVHQKAKATTAACFFLYGEQISCASSVSRYADVLQTHRRLGAHRTRQHGIEQKAEGAEQKKSKGRGLVLGYRRKYSCMRSFSLCMVLFASPPATSRSQVLKQVPELATQEPCATRSVPRLGLRETFGGCSFFVVAKYRATQKLHSANDGARGEASRPRKNQSPPQGRR